MVREAAETGFPDRCSGRRAWPERFAAPQRSVRNRTAQALRAASRVEPEEDAVAEIEIRSSGERLADETLEAALTREACGWRDKEARSQALFREVNERIEHLPAGLDPNGYDRLFCECGNPECTQQVELTRAEYEHARDHASRFVIALNHENPETESIIEENERFALVETYAGSASQIARETDPRSQANTRRHSN